MRLNPSIAPQPLAGTVEAVQRGTAGAGNAFVALWKSDIGEVVTPGPLKQIAGVRRQISQLRRRSGKNRLRKERIILPDQRMVGGIAVASQRAEPKTSIGKWLDVGKLQAIDVD